MRLGRIWPIVVIAALLALMAYAWIDGGREPVREISVDLPLPGAAR